jgi:hypothetical protein
MGLLGRPMIEDGPIGPGFDSGRLDKEIAGAGLGDT